MRTLQETVKELIDGGSTVFDCSECGTTLVDENDIAMRIQAPHCYIACNACETVLKADAIICTEKIKRGIL